MHLHITDQQVSYLVSLFPGEQVTYSLIKRPWWCFACGHVYLVEWAEVVK